MGQPMNRLPEHLQQKVREQMASERKAPEAPKPNKHGAIPTVYNGVRYDSKMEAKRAESLDEMIEWGEVFWWIGQPKFRLGCPENVYVADFLVVPAGRPVRVEEVKGRETPKFRRDKKLWSRYGPCDLNIVTKHGVEVVEGGGA